MCPRKVYCKNFKENKIGATIEDTQYELRNSRSTQNLIFIIKQANKTRIQKNRDMQIYFTDPEKAFDRI